MDQEIEKAVNAIALAITHSSMPPEARQRASVALQLLADNARQYAAELEHQKSQLRDGGQ